MKLNFYNIRESDKRIPFVFGFLSRFWVGKLWLANYRSGNKVKQKPVQHAKLNRLSFILINN